MNVPESLPCAVSGGCQGYWPGSRVDHLMNNLQNHYDRDQGGVRVDRWGTRRQMWVIKKTEKMFAFNGFYLLNA